MSTVASRSNFDSVFNSALHAYKKRTKLDLATHPLLSSLQTCDSSEAVLTILREHIFVSGQSQGGDERLTNWLVPTINVLYAFSATLSEGVGLVFSPAKVVFAGIGVLLLAAKDASDFRDTLLDLFSHIEHVFERLNIYTTVPPTPAMTSVIVEIVVEVLSFLAIATKIIKRGRTKRYLKKLIGNTEVEDAVRKLDKLTQEEAKMAAAELLKITHSIDSKVEGLDNRMMGVDERVQDIDSKMDQVSWNQLRDSLRQWLSPPDPSINYNIATDAHHIGTAQWFFQGSIFKDWQSTGSFLWVHGNPGSGKTIFCSAIIRDIMEMHDGEKSTVAFFYFDFKDINKQNRNSLLLSLLSQLAARSDPCCEILSRLYSTHDRGARRPSDRAMTDCLKDMLTFPAQFSTFLIIDALDECPNTSGIPSPREQVLELIEELVEISHPNLHLCVTSRPEFDIQTALERLNSRSVSLHDETGQKQDIIDYVTHVVRSDSRMRRWREEDKDLVIKTLSEKAGGMFRWVFCQLEILRQCFPPSIRRVLEELPESLDETYQRILRSISRANRGLAHQVLQCLVAAVRPLRVEELAEVLAMDFDTGGTPKLNPGWRWADQREAVLSACSSLVSIVNDGGSRIVQFSHFSVKEFLTSIRTAESSKDISCYHILLEPAHTIVAQACLGVLLRLDEHTGEEIIKNFPLAEYAAEHWDGHARFGNVSSLIKDGIDCLFDAEKPYFTVWRWVSNIKYSSRTSTMNPEETPLCIAALLGLRDLVERLLIKHPEDLNTAGSGLGPPLCATVAEGHTHVTSLLLEHGANADFKGMDIPHLSPMHLASRIGHVEIGKRLLDHGVDVNLRDYHGRTPLWISALCNTIEFARMLLEHDAEINVKDRLGLTPLRVAESLGHTDVARLFQGHGRGGRMDEEIRG